MLIRTSYVDWAPWNVVKQFIHDCVLYYPHFPSLAEFLVLCQMINMLHRNLWRFCKSSDIFKDAKKIQKQHTQLPAVENKTCLQVFYGKILVILAMGSTFSFSPTNRHYRNSKVLSEYMFSICARSFNIAIFRHAHRKHFFQTWGINQNYSYSIGSQQLGKTCMLILWHILFLPCSKLLDNHCTLFPLQTKNKVFNKAIIAWLQPFVANHHCKWGK